MFMASLDKFTGLASGYDKHRPGYPKKALEHIVKTCNLGDSSIVADIGCGTGISTRLLAKHGVGKVIGLEPNQDMRIVGKQQTEIDDTICNTIEFREGTAENTGFDNDSIDAILSAQAFHWFDHERALYEFHRVLKPEGFCILMWNVRSEVDEFTRGYGDIMFQHSEAVSDEVKRGVSGKHLLLSDLYESTGVNEFSNKQILDLEGLLGRAISTSYAPREEDKQEGLKEALELLYKKHSTGGNVTLKYTTSVYIAQKKV